MQTNVQRQRLAQLVPLSCPSASLLKGKATPRPTLSHTSRGVHIEKLRGVQFSFNLSQLLAHLPPCPRGGAALRRSLWRTCRAKGGFGVLGLLHALLTVLLCRVPTGFLQGFLLYLWGLWHHDDLNILDIPWRSLATSGWLRAVNPLRGRKGGQGPKGFTGTPKQGLSIL